MQILTPTEIISSRNLILLSLAILVLTYWQFLATFVPTAENEQFPEAIIPIVFTQGRFLSYLFLQLTAPITPIHNTDFLIAMLSFALSIVVIVRTWKEKIGPEHYVAIAVAAAFPTTLHMFTFTTVNMVVGLALLLSALSVVSFVRGRIIWFCCFTILALSMYQGVLLNIVVAYAFFLAVKLTDESTSINMLLKQAAVFVGLLVISAALYSATTWAVLTVADLRLRSIPVIVRIDLLFTSFSTIVPRTFQFLVAMTTGTADLYLARGRVIGAVQVLFVLLAVANCFRLCATTPKRLLCVALVLGGAALPFLSIAVTGGTSWYRMLLAAPIAMGGLAFVAAMGQRRWLQTAVVAASVVGVFSYVHVSKQLILGASLGWEADRDLSQRIVERMSTVAPDLFARKEKIPFDMVGSRDHETPWIQSVSGSTLGRSIYRYGETPVGVVAALSIMGHANFRAATVAERLMIADRVKRMPTWPAQGSVDVIDGVAVVKFMPRYSKLQLSRYCVGMFASYCADVLSGH